MFAAGDNQYGQLGNGKFSEKENFEKEFSLVEIIENILSISCGLNHTIFINSKYFSFNHFLILILLELGFVQMCGFNEMVGFETNEHQNISQTLAFPSPVRIIQNWIPELHYVFFSK